MRVTTLIFFICIIEIYADVKWIPMDVDKVAENKTEIVQLPQLKSVTKFIDNVKVIKNLLDSKSTEDLDYIDGRKEWYVIENVQN